MPDSDRVIVMFSNRARRPILAGNRFTPLMAEHSDSYGLVWRCLPSAVPRAGDHIYCDRPRKILYRSWFSPDQCLLVLEIGEGE